MNATAAPISARENIEIAFTPMRAADIDAVLVIEQRINEFPWTRGNFVDSLVSDYSAWLLRHDEEILGYALLLLTLDEAQLLNIGIAQERQRAGLGSRFMDYLMDEARRHGATRMFLEVRASNVSGRALYRRYGFAQVGERRDYYLTRQGREAALVLARDL